MNILLEQLPTTVEVDGKEYEINTDFRECINIMLAFEDSELSAYEKNMVMLSVLYPKIPENVEKAAELAIKFLNCGDDPDENVGAVAMPERVYSFEKDAKYIFSAIKQTYGVDLETIEYLHWWKFCYMFLDLREDCFFCKICDLRIRRARGKLSKEEREYCLRIKDILDLPKLYSSDETEARNKFLNLLNGSE